MSTRMWAAIGNLFRVFALVSVALAVMGAGRVVDWLRTSPPTNLVAVVAVIGLIDVGFAVLFWMAKGPMIDGSGVARLLGGVYMLFWVVSTAGFALVLLLITYFLTEDPAPRASIFDTRPQHMRKYKTPAGWHQDGKVGPSGAMFYGDEERESALGIFSSGIPLQVGEKRNGLAHVVADTGERGWIDLRTISEMEPA